jgi:hypothetical protein
LDRIGLDWTWFFTEESERTKQQADTDGALSEESEAFDPDPEPELDL